MPRPATRRTEDAIIEEFEKRVSDGLESLAAFGDVEAIVGIPFEEEEETLSAIVETARKGLVELGLARRSLILSVCSESGKEVLQKLLATHASDREVPLRGFPLGPHSSGRGWTTCALMKAAAVCKAPMVLLQPDLLPASGDRATSYSGLSPSWIALLLHPVKEEEQDLALARFSQHPLTHPVESLLTFPFITGIFACRIRQPTPGILAVSSNMAQLCSGTPDVQSHETGVYGLDPLITIRAITNGMNICQVPLGVSGLWHGLANLEQVFRQVAHVLLHQAVLNARWWLESPDLITIPTQFGAFPEAMPPAYTVASEELFNIFRREFTRLSHTLISEVVPADLRSKMEAMVSRDDPQIALCAEEWVEALQGFLLVYGFEERFYPSDIVDGFFPFFLARLSGFAMEIDGIRRTLSGGYREADKSSEKMVLHEAEHILNTQADLLISSRGRLRGRWHAREAETVAYLPRLGSWEFVPNVGVIVPQVVKTEVGEEVWANQIYKQLIDRYRGEFLDFLSERLDTRGVTDSPEILIKVKHFMEALNRELRDEMLPHRLTANEGSQKAAGEIFALFEPIFRAMAGSSRSSVIQIGPEAAEEILKKIPPANLITLLECEGIGGLLDEMDPRDALAMSAWTEPASYADQILDYIDKNCSYEWLQKSPPSLLFIRSHGISISRDIGYREALCRLAGRVCAGKMEKAKKGEFPYLWYLLMMVHRMSKLYFHSRIFDALHTRERGLGTRIVEFIRGYRGRHPLSAYSGYENMQERCIVDALKRFSSSLDERSDRESRFARLLQAACDVYHLSITLPDTTFVSLCVWTWASYSQKGGLGTPTPLSSVVERDWSAMDFLISYGEAAGLASRKSIEELIFTLVREGKASENLRNHIFRVSADPDELLISQAAAPPPPAEKLLRLGEGPILEPIGDHAWENKYVLNPAAVRLDGTIYILYRALGNDDVSRIGLAWTKDGVNIEGRLDDPIFQTGSPMEAAGCEDPRVTLIGDKLYMLYTAWDGKLSQIALASIPVEAFLESRFDRWERHGLAFPRLSNKDAVLYPETFDGKYVVYHRLDPNLWISYLDRLECPFPRTGQKIVVGPRPGMMWDGVKIGAGAPPIKTTHGWLNIYHGVDYERSYRLGAFFMDLDDPSEVLYQSPNPILEPETDYEIGRSAERGYWVPHVVFTCGAVPCKDTEIVGLDDDILVYYGAADTVIGVAKGTLRTLVPILEENEAAGNRKRNRKREAG